MAKVVQPSSDMLASLEKVEEEFEAMDEDEEEEEEEEEEETDALTFIKDESAGGTKASGISKNTKNNVIYIGHLPKGMEEEEISGFLTQFGDIQDLKLSRSNRVPHRSKGYCFVKFQDSSVAAIVATTLSGYIIMQEKRLVCHVIPFENVHPRLFKHGDKNWRNGTTNGDLVLDKVGKHQEQRAETRNRQVLENFASEEKIHRTSFFLCNKEKYKRQKLAQLGIDYDFPGYKSSFANSMTLPDVNYLLPREQQTITDKDDTAIDTSTTPSKAEKVEKVLETKSTTPAAVSQTPSKAKANFRSPVGTRSAKKPAQPSKHIATADTTTTPSKEKQVEKVQETEVTTTVTVSETPSKTKVNSKKVEKVQETQSTTTAAVSETPSKAKVNFRSPIGTRSAKKPAQHSKHIATADTATTPSKAKKVEKVQETQSTTISAVSETPSKAKTTTKAVVSETPSKAKPNFRSPIGTRSAKKPAKPITHITTADTATTAATPSKAKKVEKVQETESTTLAAVSKKRSAGALMNEDKVVAEHENDRKKVAFATPSKSAEGESTPTGKAQSAKKPDNEEAASKEVATPKKQQAVVDRKNTPKKQQVAVIDVVAEEKSPTTRKDQSPTKNNKEDPKKVATPKKQQAAVVDVVAEERSPKRNVVVLKHHKPLAATAVKKKRSRSKGRPSV